MLLKLLLSVTSLLPICKCLMCVVHVILNSESGVQVLPFNLEDFCIVSSTFHNLHFFNLGVSKPIQERENLA